MADTPSLMDPLGIWRGLAEKFEQGAKEFATRSVNSEEFNCGVHQLLNASLSSRQASQQLMQRYFEAVGVPTRADVDAITERLQSIESRLIELADAVDRLAASGGGASSGGLAVVRQDATTPSGPPRTRKPPEAPVMPTARRERSGK